MLECKWCGREVPLGAKHCSNCGQLFVPAVTCSRCGTGVPMGTRLCMNCGQIVEAPVQDAGALPPGAHQELAEGVQQTAYRSSGEAKKERPLWMRGPRVDRIYIAAVAFAWLSIFLFWVPRMNILLCCIALVIVGIGFYRYFRYPGEYGGVWINIIAASVGLLSLVLAIRVTTSVSQGNAPAILRILHFI